jgi:acetyltransferase-like isoleucine patch superfamily enzyme
MIFIRRNFRSFKKIVAISTFLFPSFLRIPILRAIGFKIGRKVTISPLTIIVADEVEIGNDVYISPLVLIFNLKKVKLGNRVYISLGNFFHSHGLGSLTMGHFSATGLFCFMDCTCDVRVGIFSCLGPHTVLVTHGNFLPKNLGFSNQYAPVNIGRYVWIMMGVKITPGVTIGDYVIAHSGTVIMANIPDNSVYAHARSNFRTYPMSTIHRKTVNDEYINRWKEALFLDLPSFIGDYFGLKIECVAEKDCWVISMPKETIKIWNMEAISDPSRINLGVRDIALFIKNGNLTALRRLSRINWLDANSYLYNKAQPSLLFDYIMFYFEMRYAVPFTIYEYDSDKK